MFNAIKDIFVRIVHLNEVRISFSFILRKNGRIKINIMRSRRIMFPRAQCTKETRTSNENRRTSELTPEEFLRPMSSSTNQPIPFRHDHYMVDPFSSQISHQSPIFQQNGQSMIHANSFMAPSGINDNWSKSTRDIGKNRYDTPVQKTMQNDYFMANYETLNQMNGPNPYIMGDISANRNPVNTRRDQMEKMRLQEKKEFMSQQGGMMNNFVDMTPQHTRKDKPNINTSTYVPMARTLAIPKDHL